MLRKISCVQLRGQTTDRVRKSWNDETSTTRLSIKHVLRRTGMRFLTENIIISIIDRNSDCPLSIFLWSYRRNTFSCVIISFFFFSNDNKTQQIVSICVGDLTVSQVVYNLFEKGNKVTGLSTDYQRFLRSFCIFNCPRIGGVHV